MEKNDVTLENESLEFAREAAKLLLEKKALDVRLYNVTGSSYITDCYVVATGMSLTHVGSLAEELDEYFSKQEITPRAIEGKRGDPWILVDYRNVIINLFDSQSRVYYNFDRLIPEDATIDIAPLKLEVDEKLKVNNKK